MILVQAGAARLLRDATRSAAREAIETIEEVARETLGEIDRIVRALREDDGRARASSRRPACRPSAELAERHRAAGLDVALEVRASRRPLPPASTGPPTASCRRR